MLSVWQVLKNLIFFSVLFILKTMFIAESCSFVTARSRTGEGLTISKGCDLQQRMIIQAIYISISRLLLVLYLCFMSHLGALCIFKLCVRQFVPVRLSRLWLILSLSSFISIKWARIENTVHIYKIFWDTKNQLYIYIRIKYKQFEHMLIL